MITKHELRLRLLDALGDHQGGLWAGRPTYADYTRGMTFRKVIAGPTHAMFGARCWVCGVDAREAERQRSPLTTAHIIYPPEPWEETIDPGDLTRSDVVLLCWLDHKMFDRWTDRPFDDRDDLRRFSLKILDQMKVGRATGEEPGEAE